MVHCLAGVSRSVCLVMAYLIQHRGLTYDEAYTLIKSKREIVLIPLPRSTQMMVS
jgi:protein-tyrosine phosphatase